MIRFEIIKRNDMYIGLMNNTIILKSPNHLAVENAVFDIVEMEDLKYGKDFIVERNK